MKTSHRVDAGGFQPQQELLASEVLPSVGFVPQKLFQLRQNRQRELWKNLQKQKSRSLTPLRSFGCCCCSHLLLRLLVVSRSISVLTFLPSSTQMFPSETLAESAWRACACVQTL